MSSGYYDRQHWKRYKTRWTVMQVLVQYYSEQDELTPVQVASLVVSDRDYRVKKEVEAVKVLELEKS